MTSPIDLRQAQLRRLNQLFAGMHEDVEEAEAEAMEAIDVLNRLQQAEASLVEDIRRLEATLFDIPKEVDSNDA